MSSPAPGPERAGLRDEARLAVAFLTILPVGLGTAPVDLRRGAPWFPLVGALVGLAAGAAHAGAHELGGAGPAAVVALTVLVVLTGALHQDGLADLADGIGARGGGPDKRLAAMRDSATGAFGTLALIGWALGGYAALTAFPDAEDAARALVAAAAAGRWAALAHAALAAPARPDGLGAGFDVGPLAVALTAVPVLALAIAACGPGPGVAVVLVAAGAAAGLALLATRLLGGRTGDTLGATVALAEVLALLAAQAA